MFELLKTSSTLRHISFNMLYRTKVWTSLVDKIQKCALTWENASNDWQWVKSCDDAIDDDGSKWLMPGTCRLGDVSPGWSSNSNDSVVVISPRPWPAM